jgi:hypothetical protein
MKPALIATHLADRHSGLVGETFAESGYPVLDGWLTEAHGIAEI